MKSTPKWIAALGALASLLTGWAHYAAVYVLPASVSTKPADTSIWHDVIMRTQSHANLLVWGCTVATALLAILAYFLGEGRYRKVLVAQQLAECAEHFSENKRAHRFTVFRVVSGWRVWAAVIWRSIFYQEDQFSGAWCKRFRNMLVMPHHTYLLPYVRPANSVNPVSCSVFRVSDRPSVCEGVAGRVWVEDDLSLTTTVAFPDGALRSIKELTEYPVNDPIRIYAEETNVTVAWKLRVMERYAKHFYGCVVQRHDGAKIGIILMDSTQNASPFPSGSSQKKQLDRKMSKEAKAIGRLLS